MKLKVDKDLNTFKLKDAHVVKSQIVADDLNKKPLETPYEKRSMQ